MRSATTDGDVLVVDYIVVEARTRFDDGDPRVVMVDGARRGDRNEITDDVLGFSDDSVLGERLHLFITPAEVVGGPLTLESVEATFICPRRWAGRTLRLNVLPDGIVLKFCRMSVDVVGQADESADPNRRQLVA